MTIKDHGSYGNSFSLRNDERSERLSNDLPLIYMELPKYKEQVKKGMEKTAYNMPNLGIFERDLLRQRTQLGLEAAGDIGIYVV